MSGTIQRMAQRLLGRGDQITKVRKDVVLRTPAFYNRHLGRKILVMGTGSSLREHGQKIKEFVATNDVIVIGTNMVPDTFTVDYHGFSNRRRFRQFGRSIDAASSRGLLSVHFPDNMIATYCDAPYDLIMWLNTEDPLDNSVGENGVIRHYGTSGTLMMLVAYAMGADQVYIAGMDGSDLSVIKNGGQLDPHEYRHTYYEYPGFADAKQAEKSAYWFQIQTKTIAAICEWAISQSRNPLVSLTPTHCGPYHDPSVLGSH